MLVSDDVFIFDTGFEIFVWIGAKASLNERNSSIGQAQQYLKKQWKTCLLANH